MIAVIPRDRWLSGDLLAADRVVHAAEDRGAVDLRADDDLWDEVLLRYQRLCPLGNPASTTPAFFDVVRGHRALHDTRDPQARADLDHAIDTWQWVLRLDPDASAEVQLAALLHDLDRRGASLARALVDDGPWVANRVARLIEGHASPAGSPEARLLADADALSFFGQGCAAFLAWFGEQATAREVAHALGRMSAAAREWLPRLRLPAGLGPLASTTARLSA